jgi:hypothetical protein
LLWGFALEPDADPSTDGYPGGVRFRVEYYPPEIELAPGAAP